MLSHLKSSASVTSGQGVALNLCEFDREGPVEGLARGHDGQHNEVAGQAHIDVHYEKESYSIMTLDMSTILLCDPVLVPQMRGTEEPPDTMNRSSMHLLSVPSGWASTKLAKSRLRMKIKCLFYENGILFYRN